MALLANLTESSLLRAIRELIALDTIAPSHGGKKVGLDLATYGTQATGV
jgi:hypothetical protein